MKELGELRKRLLEDYESKQRLCERLEDAEALNFYDGYMAGVISAIYEISSIAKENSIDHYTDT